MQKLRNQGSKHYIDQFNINTQGKRFFFFGKRFSMVDGTE